jgi:hypothetical protein
LVLTRTHNCRSGALAKGLEDPDGRALHYLLFGVECALGLSSREEALKVACQALARGAKGPFVMTAHGFGSAVKKLPEGLLQTVAWEAKLRAQERQVGRCWHCVSDVFVTSGVLPVVCTSLCVCVEGPGTV